MGAFDRAWNLLKALPEQQAFTSYAQAPKRMGDTNPALIGIERYGTVHPAIMGLLARDPSNTTYQRSSGPNLHVEMPGSLTENPFSDGKSIEYYSDIAAPDRRFVVDEQKEEDEAQKRRGSMFSGNPDEYAVPGVRLTPTQINPTK